MFIRSYVAKMLLVLLPTVLHILLSISIFIDDAELRIAEQLSIESLGF